MRNPLGPISSRHLIIGFAAVALAGAAGALHAARQARREEDRDALEHDLIVTAARSGFALDRSVVELLRRRGYESAFLGYMGDEAEPVALKFTAEPDGTFTLSAHRAWSVA